MRKLIYRWCLFGLSVLPLVSTYADPISSQTDYTGYVGLNWHFDETLNRTPNLVFGLRAMNMDSSPISQGADLSVLVNPQNQHWLDQVRLLYSAGYRDALLNIGGGYSFSKNSIFSSVNIQAPDIRLGINNYLDNHEYDYNLEINTLGELDKFRECPYAHYRIVPETYTIVVRGVPVQRLKYVCVRIS
jgi:hypothetical protein